jgi:hypothetical protein
MSSEERLMNMLDTFIKPMHPEGRRFVGIFGVITAGLFWLWEPLGWVGLGLTIWCYYFFHSLSNYRHRTQRTYAYRRQR